MEAKIECGFDSVFDRWCDCFVETFLFVEISNGMEKQTCENKYDNVHDIRDCQSYL